MHMADQFNSTKHSHLSENQDEGGTEKQTICSTQVLLMVTRLHTESRGLSCLNFILG